MTDYLEGALDGTTRRRVDEHLAACPGCTAYLDEMRVTIRLTGTLTERDLGAPVRDSLLDFRGLRRGVTPERADLPAGLDREPGGVPQATARGASSRLCTPARMTSIGVCRAGQTL